MKISTPENIDFNSLSTIIFDWGGVITDINPEASIESFQKIGHLSIRKYFEYNQDDLFFRFEKGQVKPEEIYRRLTEEIGSPVPVEKLRNALCAMLFDTPVSRIEIIKKMRTRFQLILLSNTNVIHTEFYNNLLKQKMGVNFPGLFYKVYYSYKLGMRKPDKEIFDFVIRDLEIDPEKTLFIDDSVLNIDIASSLGLNTFHLSGYSLEDVLAGWNNKD
jgi:glucose-1-phosphatase